MFTTFYTFLPRSDCFSDLTLPLRSNSLHRLQACPNLIPFLILPRSLEHSAFIASIKRRSYFNGLCVNRNDPNYIVFWGALLSISLWTGKCFRIRENGLLSTFRSVD